MTAETTPCPAQIRMTDMTIDGSLEAYIPCLSLAILQSRLDVSFPQVSLNSTDRLTN